MIDDYILTQLSPKAGLQKFGEKGCKATMKELEQMPLIREVFSEVDQDSLTYEQKRKALPVLLFLTLKHDRSTIKGRACADRRPQRIWTEKQDSTYPTIDVEALFYTLIMDAMEGRDVAICDLPGNFLQTNTEEFLLLRVNGALALLLVELNQKRQKKYLTPCHICEL